MQTAWNPRGDPASLGRVGGRTRYTDSAGYTRPVPVMLATRVRLAPAWLRKRHPVLLTALITAVVIVALAALTSGTPRHHPPCHQAGRAAACP